MAPKEDIDAIPLARKERNLTEAEAIMEIEGQKEKEKRHVIVIDWGEWISLSFICALLMWI